MLHSFRVGGAASHRMGGTTMDVLIEYVTWRFSAVTNGYEGISGGVEGN